MADDPTTITALTAADINTTMSDEPRILDERLAQALGFDRPRDIRKLIVRYLAALERFGKVRATVAQTGPKGGRPPKTYWLTKRQALYLCTKSEAPLATEVTIQMVEVFDAWQRGEFERKIKPVKVREHRRSMPSRSEYPPKFDPRSDLSRDLLYVFKSAMKRVQLGQARDIGVALFDVMTDVIACNEDVTYEPRGATLDWNYRRANDAFREKLVASGQLPEQPRLPLN